MAGAHLTAVLIPKIMRAFAFGILIFAFCLNRNVLQSSAANTRANKLRTRGEKIESNRNETFYISKSITIKHIKLLLFLNSKKWRCRERERQRKNGFFAMRADSNMEAKHIFIRHEMASSWMGNSQRNHLEKQQVELICMLILVSLNSDKPLICACCVPAFVRSPIPAKPHYNVVLNTKWKRIEW